jgi:beta-N-acetylhexosaminidase
VSAARLDAVEIPPFAAAVRAGVAMMMTAHVVYRAIDAERPATMSPRVCTELLRGRLGFEGVLVSDDLEMKAISDRLGVEDAAVGAIAAGCDALLICSDIDAQARAHAALVARATRDAAFRARCEQAAARVLRMRRQAPPRVCTREEILRVVGGPESRAALDELSRSLSTVERA